MPTYRKKRIEVNIPLQAISHQHSVCQRCITEPWNPCEIFIATFIASIDENPRKPNRSQGYRHSQHLLIFGFAMKTVKVASDLRNCSKDSFWHKIKMLHFPLNYFFPSQNQKKKAHESLQSLGPLPISFAHQMLHQCNIFKQVSTQKNFRVNFLKTLYENPKNPVKT